MVLTRRACSAEGPVMTEMIEPVARGGQQQELAQRLVEQAHAEGVELIGPGRLLPGLTKTVLETALQAEITGHLGYDKHDPAGRDRGNSRNGTPAENGADRGRPGRDRRPARARRQLHPGDRAQTPTPPRRDRPDRPVGSSPSCRPGSVGVSTRWPAARRCSATGRQAQPPCRAS
jgi:hypothetical protein